MTRVLALIVAALGAGILAVPRPASADIFQWEYVNPADPSQGKQASTTLCPGGAAVNAWPSADLNSRNLSMAYLINASLNGATLTSANLSVADLTNAYLGNAN